MASGPVRLHLATGMGHWASIKLQKNLSMYDKLLMPWSFLRAEDSQAGMAQQMVVS